MSIVENADLKLTITVYADEFEDLAALVRDAAKEIKRGSTASNVGGCIGSYQFIVEEQSRAVEHGVQSDDCPSCAGSGKKEVGGMLLTCLACDGTGNRL